MTVHRIRCRFLLGDGDMQVLVFFTLEIALTGSPVFASGLPADKNATRRGEMHSLCSCLGCRPFTSMLGRGILSGRHCGLAGVHQLTLLSQNSCLEGLSAGRC